MLIDVLQEIQQNNMSPSENGQLPAPETIIMPTSQKLYEVDLSTRTISGPDSLSVQSDHYAETVYFVMDRYYDHMDLAQTNCVVQYVSNGESYVYAVPFCDITTYEGKIIIPWTISLSATKNSGKVRYFIKFYILEKDFSTNETYFTYCLNTLPASSNILRTLSSEDFENENQVLELPDRYLELINDFGRMLNNVAVYWNDV